MFILFLNEHSREPAFSGLKKAKCKSIFFFFFNDYFIITAANVWTLLLKSLHLIHLVSITKIRPKGLTENNDKLNTASVTGAPQK